MRRGFTKGQKAAMIKRAMRGSSVIYCEGCGLNITGKVIEFDHTIPEAMRLEEDKIKPLTIEEGKALGRDCCHSPKTHGKHGDIANIAQAKRREASNLGVKTKGRGFPPRQMKSSSMPMIKTPLPRRALTVGE
jgi:hypothetical protein